MKRVKAREAEKKTACKVHIKVTAYITLQGADTYSTTHACCSTFASPHMALLYCQTFPHAELPVCHLTRYWYILKHATYSITSASPCMAWVIYSPMQTCSIGSVHDNTTHIVVPSHNDSRAVQLKYHSMNKEEMNAIAEAQNKGDMDLLYKHPRLKSIAGQGVITIKLNSVDRLVHPSWWRGGHKHV